MADSTQLARRERQIVEIVFAKQNATVQEIRDELPDPPTPMAIRRMLAILMEKGFLKRQKRGREFVYLPRQTKRVAGLQALRQVLSTFFDGSVEAALAAHLEKPGARLDRDELRRLSQLIEELSPDDGE
jgi:BlaI family penicillinase repressor